MDQVRYLEFAGFRLDAGARRLMRMDGTQVLLKSRAFDTLLALVARRGETLPKKLLLDTVWPGVVVADNNLNQAVSALRKALDDTEAPHRIIVTIPGRGFCFVAELRTSFVALQHSDAQVTQLAKVMSVADYF